MATEPSPSTGRRCPEDRMTHDLTARIDERLAATEGHTPALWVADYVGDNAYLISSVTPGTIDGNLRQIGLITHMPDDARMEDAALIASAPTLRALLVEAAARIRDLEAQLAAQAEALVLIQAALTPSVETKAAYSGEFYVEIDYHNPEWDEESETSDEPEFLTDRVMVPWDVIKQIMATIGARTLLGAQS